jgi:hypothetical protein
MEKWLFLKLWSIIYNLVQLTHFYKSENYITYWKNDVIIHI